MSDGDVFDEDLFDKIKKLLNLNTDMFDMDMFFLPEPFKEGSESDEADPQDGFKVSYHFERGMDKPEVHYKGKVDPEKIKELLKNAGPKNIRKIDPRKLFEMTKKKPPLDATSLSLEKEPREQQTRLNICEPYCEVNEFNEFNEIIIEVPGIKKEDVILTFSEEGKKLTLSAYNDNKRYLKVFHLPFESDLDHCAFAVNNGIATLKVMKVAS